MNFLLTLFLLSSWVEVRSDTFVVKSPMGAEQATAVLEDLETFYQIVGNGMFEGVRLPELPLEVLVLEPDEMEDLRTEYEGRDPPASYYLTGINRGFIVLSTDLSGRRLTRVIYHELTHYLSTHASDYFPTWLEEGLAEYLASSRVEENGMSVDGTSPFRMGYLREGLILSLEDLFAVDRTSPYYNEQDKAEVFYSQAWAVVDFLMHGRFADEFNDYLDTLRVRETQLTEFIPLTLGELESEFLDYIQDEIGTREARRFEGMATLSESIPEPINRTWVDVSIAEMLLSQGRIEDTGPYLEAASDDTKVEPRVAYWRGLLAWSAGDAIARDHFIDALIDPEIAPLAAFQLVLIGELDVSEVLAVLERAANEGTEQPLVYWALSEIYLNQRRRIEDLVQIAATRHSPPPLPSMPPLEADEELVYVPYVSTREAYLEYELLSASSDRPEVRSLVHPYYPGDLRNASVGGQVELDVQLSSVGDVIGVWLISASPDVFGNLATGAVRNWKFDPVPAKIRIVLRFTPTPDSG